MNSSSKVTWTLGIDRGEREPEVAGEGSRGRESTGEEERPGKNCVCFAPPRQAQVRPGEVSTHMTVCEWGETEKLQH